MTFWVKVVEDWSFDERLFQFGKGFPSSECEKAQLRLFGLRQFLNFCPNLIIFNLIAINPSSIVQFTSATPSFATTNLDSALTGSCLWLNTPWNLQYRGKWCSYPTESLDELLIKVRESKEHLDVSYWLRLRLLLDSLDFFVLYTDAFQGYHIAEEPNLFLMKLTFLQVSEKQELPKLLQHLLYGWDMSISVIINVNQDIIQVHNDEDVKLFRKDLVDIPLKACWGVH